MDELEDDTDQAFRDETIGPFLIPDVRGRDTDVVHVAPVREARNELSTMIRDLLTGSLASGQAACDWLRERMAEPDRLHQYSELSRLIRRLFRVAMVRAKEADSEPQRLRINAQAGFAERIVSDWEGFCCEVTELFAFDLYVMDDAMRFTNEVLLPGKMSEFGEGA